MKQICLLLVCLYVSNFGVAQTESTPSKQKELGVNTTAFISNFLALNNSTPSVTPLSFLYKSGDDHGAFRLLAGVMGRSTSTDQEGADFSESNSALNAFVRSGKEWRFSLGERWRPYAGIDGFSSFERQIFETNSSFDDFKNTDQTITIGAGTVLGMQFFITERISLLTETYLDIFYENGFIKSEGSFSNFTQKSEGYGFATTLPTNIYFLVSF